MCIDNYITYCCDTDGCVNCMKKHGGGGAKPFGSSYGGHDSYGNNNNSDFGISNLSIRSVSRSCPVYKVKICK